MSSTAALLPAAGLGLRLGAGPKALLRLNGRPMLEIVLDSLKDEVDEIIIGVPPAHSAKFRQLFPDHRLIEGGATRQATVQRLLQATSAEYVLIHDAARPFLPRAVTRRVMAAARQHGAASAALAVVDTLIERNSGRPVPREELAAVQTPQAFARSLLVRAHEAASEHGVEATDDAGLVRLLGEQVQLVEGSPWLSKVTFGADLLLAQLLERGFSSDTAD